MTSEGFPVFFIVTNTTPFNAQNIEREMLSVQYDMPCTLISDDDEQNNAYSIITLRASEVSLQSYFIEIFLMMLGKIPAIPSKRELAIEVENLISIFSASKESSGLVGWIAGHRKKFASRNAYFGLA